MVGMHDVCEIAGRQHSEFSRRGFELGMLFTSGEREEQISKQRDEKRKKAREGRVDLGKGQRHLPTPSDCHPSSHCSHIKLKD